MRKATVVEHLMPADLSSIKQESSILKACCIHFINYGQHSKQEMEALVRKLGGTVSTRLSVRSEGANCVAPFACAVLLTQVRTAAASTFMLFCLLSKIVACAATCALCCAAATLRYGCCCNGLLYTSVLSQHKATDKLDCFDGPKT